MLREAGSICAWRGLAFRPGEIGTLSRLALAGWAALALVPAAHAAQDDSSGTCAPEGDVKFICTPTPTEDVVRIPGTRWVLGSGFHEGSGIRLIGIDDRSVRTLFPTGADRELFDRATYGQACPGPLDPQAKSAMRLGGLTLHPAEADGTFRLYVVMYGARESVEVFTVDARGAQPLLAWVGCVTAPEPLELNSVGVLPDGGFIASNFREVGEGRAASFAKARAGEDNGRIYRWTSDTGWSPVPGGEASGANGVAVSSDGRWVFVGEWGARSIFRLSLGREAPNRVELPVPFHVDNLHWADDGRLLATGHDCVGDECEGRQNSAHVVAIDPRTMELDYLVRRADSEAFGFATGAAMIDDTIWVGSFISNRIAIFPQPR